MERLERPATEQPAARSGGGFQGFPSLVHAKLDAGIIGEEFLAAERGARRLPCSDRRPRQASALACSDSPAPAAPALGSSDWLPRWGYSLGYSDSPAPAGLALGSSV